MYHLSFWCGRRMAQSLFFLFIGVVLGTAPLTVRGQRIEAGFLVGGANYQGDLADNTLQLQETKLSYGGLLRYHLNDNIILRASFTVGTLSGSDLNNPRTASRAFTFTGKFNEFALMGEWHFLRPRGRSSSGLFHPYFSPFVFLGIGSTTCKAKPIAPATTVPYPFPEAADVDNFICMPAGIGVKYHFADQFSIGLELGSRTVFSDYLDGVSKTANPDRNDWYIIGGLSLTYILNDPFAGQ